jgi:hypothetical protein
MDATASTRRPSMWNSSSQYSAFATRKLPHLAPPEVEDQRSPVHVLAEQRIAVLVERAAVELRQRPLVLREVRGNPVHDDADAGLVQLVDEVLEVIGVSEAGRSGRSRRSPGSPRIRRTDAPRTGMSSTCVNPLPGDVLDELLREVAVAQPDAPGGEVDFVDTHRPVVRVRSGTPGHPFVVFKRVPRFDDADPVSGGTSVPRAIGSAFSRQ